MKKGREANKEDTMGFLNDQVMVSQLSRHFAMFMVKLAGENIPGLHLAAGMVSHYADEGHVCLNLSSIAGKPLLEVCGGGDGYFPELSPWIETLRGSEVIGRPGEFKPLILDEAGRLYLYRYWEYEKKLSQSLCERITHQCSNLDLPLLQDGLKRLFPKTMIKDTKENNETDWQKVAAFTAAYRMFCIISGGPGTGKTSTVVKILALLLEQARGKSLRMALAAPTGKAAVRLKESIGAAKRELSFPSEIRAFIPDDVLTVHRLLGSIHGSSYFRYHEGNLLPYDLVVVDEASMVDLPLMTKLLQALSLKSRLIIVGDKDQLASVEAGAVLGDICGQEQVHAFSPDFARTVAEITGEKIVGRDSGKKCQDSIVLLRKSYRFDSHSGIGLLSQAIKEGESAKAMELLKSGQYSDISWRRWPGPGNMAGSLTKYIIEGYSEYLKVDDPYEAFYLFNRFRILCALRKGVYGVDQVSLLVEKVLHDAGLIQTRSRWYQGQAIMITRNDYRSGLFNGDVGIIWSDQESGRDDFRVYFPTHDGGMRKVIPTRLPEHEKAYAMTVHKSQGSEFDRVLLLLPDRDSEVLSRELMYTGITRAKEQVEVWGQEEVFQKAVLRRIQRHSGLRDSLWK